MIEPQHNAEASRSIEATKQLYIGELERLSLLSREPVLDEQGQEVIINSTDVAKGLYEDNWRRKGKFTAALGTLMALKSLELVEDATLTSRIDQLYDLCNSGDFKSANNTTPEQVAFAANLVDDILAYLKSQ